MARQLGREPRGVLEIAYWCPNGEPGVVKTAPKLPDGTPFPTLYYLTHPALTAAGSRLESSGLMREMTERLQSDPELAAEAGLSCEDGILVDEFGRTADETVYAIGDCTRFPSRRYGRKVRLECVQNAFDQAKAAAMAILGKGAAYNPVPWFWSDQYDVKFQSCGLSAGHDEAKVVGDPGAPHFSVEYRKDGRLIAVDAINDARAYMMGRKTIALETA